MSLVTRIRDWALAAPLLALLLALASGIPGASTVAAQEEPEAEPGAAVEQPATPEPAEETIEGEAAEGLRYRGDRVGVFTNVDVPEDMVVRGAVCVFGECTVEGEVQRDLVVVFGNLTLSGNARHDVVCVFSDVTLEEGSTVGHDLVNVGGHLDDRGAYVDNQIVNLPFFSWIPSIGSPFGFLGALLAWGNLLKVLLTFVVLLVFVAFAQDRIRTLSSEATVKLGIAFLVGLLVQIADWVVVLLLVATVIGIPLVIILDVLFKILTVFGLAGLFHLIGMKIGRAFGREMSTLGAVLLGFLPFAVILVVPFFLGLVGIVFGATLHFLFWLLVKVPAIGLVFVTRFGLGPRPVTAAPSPPAPRSPEPPPAPPAPPPPPASGPPPE